MNTTTISHVSRVSIRSVRFATIIAALELASSTYGALVFNIPAPNGVGDVVALTNALARISAAPDNDNSNGKFKSKVWLAPGVYDLSGIYMTGGSHLNLPSCQGGLIAGLGDGPEDVVLLGGGEVGAHRVLYADGSNYDWLTISNLTVTGGWSTSDGGGIWCDGALKCIDLIVSNNYAKGSNGGGGGGILRGHAENCLFADNRTDQRGGGLWCNGGSRLRDKFVQGSWNCVFTNNAAAYGGGQYGKGKYIESSFFCNRAGRGGAIETSASDFTWNGGQFANTVEVTGCTFIGNALTGWGYGSAIYNSSSESRPLLAVSNCTFTANVDTKGGDGIVHGCDMSDCAITGNYRTSHVIWNCNMNRCLVAANTNNNSGECIDDSSTISAYTNVNCLFLGNINNGYGHITKGKILVNCTYAKNESVGGGNYGGITSKCPSWNCLFAGNRIGGVQRDIRANYLGSTASLVLTNCVIGVADVTEDYTGLSNCRVTTKIKVVDEANGNYTPMPGSPAADKGAGDVRIQTLVGKRDLAGNRRVFGKGIDIGAFECQDNSPTTFFIVR